MQTRKRTREGLPAPSEDRRPAPTTRKRPSRLEDSDGAEDSHLSKARRVMREDGSEVKAPPCQKGARCNTKGCKTCDARGRKQKSRAEEHDREMKRLLKKPEAEEEGAPGPIRNPEVDEELKEDRKELKESEFYVYCSDGSRRVISQENIDHLDVRFRSSCYWHLVGYGGQTPEAIKDIAGKCYADPNCLLVYACGRYEEGEEGHAHHQVFAVFKKPVIRSVAMKAVFGPEAVYYCKPMYAASNVKDSIKYCNDPKKPGLLNVPFALWSVGNQDLIPTSSKQSASKLIFEGIHSGLYKSATDVFADKEVGAAALHLGSRLQQAFDLKRRMDFEIACKAKGIVLPSPAAVVVKDKATECEMYCGVPGAGKTHRANIRCGAKWDEKTRSWTNTEDIYYVNAGHRNKWNSYLGQTKCIVNDHDGTEKFGFSIETLKGIVDSIPFRLDAHATSGGMGFVQCNIQLLVITSNRKLEDWELLQKKGGGLDERLYESLVCTSAEGGQGRISHYEYLTEKFKGSSNRPPTKLFLNGQEVKDIGEFKDKPALQPLPRPSLRVDNPNFSMGSSSKDLRTPVRPRVGRLPLTPYVPPPPPPPRTLPIHRGHSPDDPVLDIEDEKNREHDKKADSKKTQANKAAKAKDKARPQSVDMDTEPEDDFFSLSDDLFERQLAELNEKALIEDARQTKAKSASKQKSKSPERRARMEEVDGHRIVIDDD